MVRNLLYQMRVKLRAEQAGLSSINWESGQIVLRYPSGAEPAEDGRLPDLAPDVRGGRGAYWCSFGKDVNWPERLLDVLQSIPEAATA